MGDSPKWIKSKKRREKKKKKRKRERLNDGDNNGQATHGARKHAWRTQAAWAKRKRERERERERLNDGNNNGQLRIANATSGGTRKAACANVFFPPQLFSLHGLQATSTRHMCHSNHTLF